MVAAPVASRFEDLRRGTPMRLVACQLQSAVGAMLAPDSAQRAQRGLGSQASGCPLGAAALPR